MKLNNICATLVFGWFAGPSSVWGDTFSCPFGKIGVCVSSYESVCKSFSKCVDADAVCFSKHTCDYEGFVCESDLLKMKKELNLARDAEKTCVNDYDDLIDKVKQIQTSIADERMCILSAKNLTAAKSCINGSLGSNIQTRKQDFSVSSVKTKAAMLQVDTSRFHVWHKDQRANNLKLSVGRHYQIDEQRAFVASSDGLSTLYAYLPKISSKTRSRIAVEINAKLLQKINISQYIEGFEDRKECLIPTDCLDWTYLDYDILANTARYISLIVKVERFSGGAHPMNYQIPFIFSAETGDDIRISDFVASNASGSLLHRLAEKIKSDTTLVLFDEWEAEIDLDRVYYALTKSALVAYFPAGMIAPNSSGIISAELKIKEISDLLSKNQNLFKKDKE